MGKYRKGSCGSGHYCGSGEIQKRLLREQTLLRQWGNTEKAPTGAGTAAAVKKKKLGGLCGREGEGGGGGGGGGVTERGGCYGVSEVF